MRTREEIEGIYTNGKKYHAEKEMPLNTELLLDIRELLMNPPLEIQGVEDRNLSELNHE